MTAVGIRVKRNKRFLRERKAEHDLQLTHIILGHGTHRCGKKGKAMQISNNILFGKCYPLRITWLER